jgi:hypothetical protein
MTEIAHNFWVLFPKYRLFDKKLGLWAMFSQTHLVTQLLSFSPLKKCFSATFFKIPILLKHDVIETATAARARCSQGDRMSLQQKIAQTLAQHIFG